MGLVPMSPETTPDCARVTARRAPAAGLLRQARGDLGSWLDGLRGFPRAEVDRRSASNTGGQPFDRMTWPSTGRHPATSDTTTQQPGALEHFLLLNERSQSYLLLSVNERRTTRGRV